MLHPFERHIQSTIERLNLLRRSSPVLVALSGGADSVALLSALNALGYDTIAAHCNFHLRGAESNRDMRHAESIARRLGVNIHVRDFNVAERMKLTGESVEMACRELRYDWFNSLIDRDRAQAVAVAHHREDNVETFFLNLLRSTGIDGLTGMAWRREYVVRPMLDLSRDEIESYLRDKGLGFVTDSSNASNDFARNRLRNIFIPMLEKEFPGASKAILNVMSNLGDSRLLVGDAVSSWLGQAGENENRINIVRLIESAGERRASAVLFEHLKHFGFNAEHISGIIGATLAGRSGRRFVSSERIAELDRGVLTIRHPEGVSPRSRKTVGLTRDILSPVNIEISYHHITEFSPDRDPMVAYFDRRILDGDPVFELRHPSQGDRISPFGLTGDKLVSKLLKDAHRSAAEKRSTWILTRNNDVLWVLGLRASRLFSLTPDTKEYIRLIYRP
ncbi:MAG: tRNA lysidine(34) synthetase TilS [Muribaculaceae bacterium]|nr:tRNA lysidine(34) synthetase TilS [Muribaculaceae bacterium]